MSIKDWKTLNNIKPQQELGHIEAGRDAEEYFLNLVESHFNHDSVDAFVGKRVPKPGRGRYEIDIILLSGKKLYLIEIKNWSGTLSSEQGEWVQTKRNGEQIRHKDICQLNQKKLEAIQAYFNKRGVAVPKGFAAHKTVFMNQNLAFLGNEISGDDSVIRRQDLGSFLNSQKGAGFGRALVFALIDFIFGKQKQVKHAEALPAKTLLSMKQHLRELRTWDELEMYGGRVLTGDAIELVVDGRTYDLRDKESGQGLVFHWNRKRFASLVYTFIGEPLGYVQTQDSKIPLRCEDDYVLFHNAGSRQPEQVRVASLCSLTKG
ncbi:nuclease-related domain-containing protein [Vibrio breoganii]|uniref:NERD domain-containing protein n=1 Tax=Vibrio breoganii TaxID=553239 RepID=A0ABX1U656_9VIBR|nr:nuclease-related domain-containing protein [Vibrio breoganii]NMO74616.1 NERD domain-containing protein [Vibrio breoganii]NMR69928.1 NERD domain-containing protein [Vibrio breoganii]PMG06751.1 hypothetical protein BCV02_03755 [Vibrio breoganii]PML89788.1 hypothetical protein BCT67_07650 [Vibrio breoganii]